MEAKYNHKRAAPSCDRTATGLTATCVYICSLVRGMQLLQDGIQTQGKQLGVGVGSGLGLIGLI